MAAGDDDGPDRRSKATPMLGLPSGSGKLKIGSVKAERPGINPTKDAH